MMMIGKGTLKKKIATKAIAASANHHPVAQRAFSDADYGVDDDGEHSGLQSKETPPRRSRHCRRPRRYSSGP
jgi:hypothetical protein